MKTITVKKASPLEGCLSNRPVRFSLAYWCWYFTDTPATDAVEKVTGQVRVVRA